MTGMDRSTISGLVNKTFSFVIAMGVAVYAAIPFAINAKAEDVEQTYYVGSCITYRLGKVDQWNNIYDFSDDVRLTVIRTGNGNFPFLVSTTINSGVWNRLSSYAGCPIIGTNFNFSSIVVDGITYYYHTETWSSGVDLITVDGESVSDTWGYTVLPYMNAAQTAIYYTYGAGAVAPPEPDEPDEPDEGLGQLKDVSYSTDVIGYQGYGYANKDTISWNRFTTTTNHYLTPSYHEIEIRVVSAEYLASTESGLKLLDTSELQMDLTNSATLYRGSPDPGYFTVSWQQVFTALSLTFTDIWDIKEVLQNQTAYWTREGWVYQIRIYCIPENEYSEWQNIYPLVSSSGDSMQGFTSTGDPVYNTDFNDYYDLVNSMNNTSIVNNNYNNIMTINNNEYVTNPDNHITNETNNDITNNFIENFKEYHEKEDDYIGNFQDVLEDIDPTSEVIDDANFLSAGNWVKTQYVRMVQGTPIEKLVQFSLTLGLGILIIGKAK